MPSAAAPTGRRKTASPPSPARGPAPEAGSAAVPLGARDRRALPPERPPPQVPQAPPPGPRLPPRTRRQRVPAPRARPPALTREPRSRRSSASSSSSTSPKTSCSRHRSAAGLSSSSVRRFRCRSRLSSSAAAATTAVTALGAAVCPACGVRWDERAAFRGVPPLPSLAFFPGIAPALRSALVRLLRSGGILSSEEKRRRSRGAPLRMCRGVSLAAAAQPRGAGRSLRRLEPRDRHSRATSLPLSPTAPPRVGVPQGRPIFRV